MKLLQLITLVLSLLVHAGCATTSPSAASGYELRVRYAQVMEVRREPLPSVAPVGAIVGGFTGLLLSRNKTVGSQVASGVGGAALGGLATRALEGDRLGYGYQLRYADGSVSRFISEKGYISEGDCVSVERGKHANIRRVAANMCAFGAGSNSAKTPLAVDPVHLKDANQCHEAKEQLLAASTENEIDTAARKVEIICQYKGN